MMKLTKIVSKSVLNANLMKKRVNRCVGSKVGDLRTKLAAFEKKNDSDHSQLSVVSDTVSGDVLVLDNAEEVCATNEVGDAVTKIGLQDSGTDISQPPVEIEDNSLIPFEYSSPSLHNAPQYITTVATVAKNIQSKNDATIIDTLLKYAMLCAGIYALGATAIKRLVDKTADLKNTVHEYLSAENSQTGGDHASSTVPKLDFYTSIRNFAFRSLNAYMLCPPNVSVNSKV